MEAKEYWERFYEALDACGIENPITELSGSGESTHPTAAGTRISSTQQINNSLQKQKSQATNGFDSRGSLVFFHITCLDMKIPVNLFPALAL